jgi:flagellar basal body-associated protein FliL
MKKIIVIAIAMIILLGFAGYVFVAKKSANRESVQPAQKETETPAQPIPKTMIDTNDNLDEALQDLELVGE